jgi:hypothetical protein
MKSPTEMMGEVNLANSPSQGDVNACLQWVQQKEDKELSKYDSLSDTNKSYALMHRETMGMVKSVFGKEQNACKPGTNVWDAYIVYAQESGKSNRQYSSDAASVAKFGIVTTGAVKLADSLMGAAGDKIGGDKVNSGRDANKTTNGDIVQEGNTNKADISDTKLSQVQTTTGGGAATIHPATINKETPEAPVEIPEEAPAEVPIVEPVI